jgi:hypothetical protein
MYLKIKLNAEEVKNLHNVSLYEKEKLSLIFEKYSKLVN